MSSSPLSVALNSSLLRRSTSRPAILDPGDALIDPDERLLLVAPDPTFPMKVGSSPRPPISVLPLPGTLFRRAWSRLQGPLFFLWVVFCGKVAMDSVLRMDVQLRNNLLYETFLYYNPLLLVGMMIWLWGINIWVFMTCRINYAKIFELDSSHLSYKETWTIASWVTVIVLTSMTAYLYLSSHGEGSLAASQPVLLYSVLPLIMVLPVDVFYVSSRIFFLRTLVRIILPFQPITFADFFVADILTSMAKVISDLERATCRMFHGQVATLSWFEPDSTCGSHSLWIPCILALPYLFRFFQCLRQYSDTRDRTCISNALKYATAFPVILLSALKYHVVAEHWKGIYRPLWLLSGLINSCFSFYWDIARDWDLSFFQGLCHTKYPPLRSNLLYSPHWVYYGAIGNNLLLRCTWTYKLSSHLRHNYITVFLMTALEILRRFQWIFFRVESEWNKMTTRVNPQISLKETPKDVDRLLSSLEHNV